MRNTSVTSFSGISSLNGINQISGHSRFTGHVFELLLNPIKAVRTVYKFKYIYVILTTDVNYLTVKMSKFLLIGRINT